MAMGETSILIAHPDRKTQRIVQRILGVTGHRIDIADTLDQGLELLQHHVPLLVVVDGAWRCSPARRWTPCRRSSAPAR